MIGMYEWLVFAHLLAFAVWFASAFAASLAGRTAFSIRSSDVERALALKMRHGALVMARTALATLVPVSLSLVQVGGYGEIGWFLPVMGWLAGLGWLALIWVPRYVSIPLTDRQYLIAETAFPAAGALLLGLIAVPSLLGLGPLGASWQGAKAGLGMVALATWSCWTWFLAPRETDLAESATPGATRLAVIVVAGLLYCVMLAAAFFGNAKPG